MNNPSNEPERPSRRISRFLVDQPMLVAIWVGLAILGVLIAVFFFDSDWPLLHRTIVGLLSGLGVALFLTASRAIRESA